MPQGTPSIFPSAACRSAPRGTHTFESVIPCVEITDWNLAAEGVSFHRCAWHRYSRKFAQTTSDRGFIGPGPFSSCLIHPSAWNRDSQKLGSLPRPVFVLIWRKYEAG